MSDEEKDYTPMLPFLRYYSLVDEVLEILTRPHELHYFSHKIEAIKHVRLVTGWFLLDSKNFVDSVMTVVDNGANIDLIALAENSRMRDYDNEAFK